MIIFIARVLFNSICAQDKMSALVGTDSHTFNSPRTFLSLSINHSTEMGKKILVTGCCGYIGSHTIVDLIQNGFEVISADGLSQGQGR